MGSEAGMVFNVDSIRKRLIKHDKAAKKKIRRADEAVEEAKGAEEEAKEEVEEKKRLVFDVDEFLQSLRGEKVSEKDVQKAEKEVKVAKADAVDAEDDALKAEEDAKKAEESAKIIKDILDSVIKMEVKLATFAQQLNGMWSGDYLQGLKNKISYLEPYVEKLRKYNVMAIKAGMGLLDRGQIRAALKLAKDLVKKTEARVKELEKGEEPGVREKLRELRDRVG